MEAEELGELFVVGEKPAVLKLPRAVRGFVRKQRTTDPCPEEPACSFYSKGPFSSLQKDEQAEGLSCA